jgi:hypothetical protein
MHNEELRDLYSSPSIIKMNTENEMGGTCSTEEGEEKCVYAIGGKSRRKDTTRKTKI